MLFAEGSYYLAAVCYLQGARVGGPPTGGAPPHSGPGDGSGVTQRRRDWRSVEFSQTELLPS